MHLNSKVSINIPLIITVLQPSHRVLGLRDLFVNHTQV